MPSANEGSVQWNKRGRMVGCHAIHWLLLESAKQQVRLSSTGIGQGVHPMTYAYTRIQGELEKIAQLKVNNFALLGNRRLKSKQRQHASGFAFFGTIGVVADKIAACAHAGVMDFFHA